MYFSFLRVRQNTNSANLLPDHIPYGFRNSNSRDRQVSENIDNNTDVEEDDANFRKEQRCQMSLLEKIEKYDNRSRYTVITKEM